LRVALIHYHLRTGGVTRVIRDQVDALAGIAETMVITGEAPPGPLPCPAAVVPALAYDRDRAEPVGAAAAAREIVAAARAAWPGGASLYHFHNPTLGKNRRIAAIIGRLQGMGEAVLLQIHDFAEDGRPDLVADEPYPADCHYAAINRRDVALLARAGLSAAGLHYLPNAVRPLRPPAVRGDGRLFLYPVRAIRRKNIGEALLLSLFLPAGRRIGVTLEPTGALDRRSYEGWKAFARERSLPVSFGIGAGRTLDSLLADCAGVITTSIKEGFGFAYLEPWTAGLALHGRYLPEVCPDFREAGLALDHLYEGVRVTLSRDEAEALARKRRLCLPGAAAPADGAGDADFGDLSEDLQRQALERVLESAAARARLLEANPALAGALRARLPREVVEANRKVVLERFSLEAAGAALAGAYRAVLDHPVRHALDKAVLLRELGGSARSLLLCPASYE
jgi:hypothetical protein